MASTSPPTSTRTRPPRRRSPRSCRRRCWPLASMPAWRRSADLEVRALVKAEIDRGISGWENVARDPGWGSIRISFAASHPDWSGRTLDGAQRRPRARTRGRRLRGADGRPPRRLDRDRLHERAGRRDDHGRAVDRGLHRRGSPSARPPDPRCGQAAPAHLREHRPGPRHVRAGPRDRAARDRGGQADVRAGRAARVARSGRGPRGRRRRPRGLRPGDHRGRRHLYRAGAPPRSAWTT